VINEITKELFIYIAEREIKRMGLACCGNIFAYGNDSHVAEMRLGII
jgi:hypothetical protein